jgi:hypothetical protein
MLTEADAIIASGSLLARTAIELAARHPISDGINGEPWCLNCWSLWPCGPAQHAREVCNAAGVDLPGAPVRPAAVDRRGTERDYGVYEPVPALDRPSRAA